MKPICQNCRFFVCDADDHGMCVMMEDYGQIWDFPFPKDKAAGFTLSNAVAGVYVGVEFGCIHWRSI